MPRLQTLQQIRQPSPCLLAAPPLHAATLQQTRSDPPTGKEQPSNKQGANVCALSLTTSPGWYWSSEGPQGVNFRTLSLTTSPGWYWSSELRRSAPVYTRVVPTLCTESPGTIPDSERRVARSPAFSAAPPGVSAWESRRGVSEAASKRLQTVFLLVGVMVVVQGFHNNHGNLQVC
eukprot:359460-Chlamydomonas_euryale.AAC.6